MQSLALHSIARDHAVRLGLTFFVFQGKITTGGRLMNGQLYTDSDTKTRDATPEEQEMWKRLTARSLW